MDVFGVAIVGAGGISRAHIEAAKATGGRVRVVAVVDPLVAARRSAADAADCPAYGSFEEFLASDAAEQARGVIVCTPPSARLSIIDTALSRGMHVLAEKPLAHTIEDAAALEAMARRHPQLVTAVGYCHRFTPAVAEIKRRIAAGEIGDVTRFENTFACSLPAMRQHWMSDPAVSGGGSFIDTGCHSLDLFLHLIGPGTVHSAIFHHAWPGRGESSATVMLRSDRDGIAGVIQSGWTEPARFVVNVIGTKGSLSYDYEAATELLLRGNDGRIERLTVETHEVRFLEQLQAVADAATGVKTAVAPASFSDGFMTAACVVQAQKLANSRQ